MKTKLENNMEEIFDIASDTKPIIDVIAEKREVAKVEETPPDVVEPEDNQVSKDIEADYNFVRQNLREIIGTTQNSIEDIDMVARTSESPRAYEVLAGMIKTLVDANQSLLDTHKKVGELKEKAKDDPKSRAANGGNVTNALFVGSTSELMKMINNDS